MTANKIHTIWADGSKHSKDEYYFDPIPITPEILEKNGWEKGNSHTLLGANTYRLNIDYKGFDYTLAYKFPPHQYLCFDSYDEMYYRLYETKILPKYVHELQHALRLCKLTELADNFKIE